MDERSGVNGECFQPNNIHSFVIKLWLSNVSVKKAARTLEVSLLGYVDSVLNFYLFLW